MAEFGSEIVGFVGFEVGFVARIGGFEVGFVPRSESFVMSRVVGIESGARVDLHRISGRARCGIG